MELSDYHRQYQNQTDIEVLQKAFEKKQELDLIFSRMVLKTKSKQIKVGVLGCGDLRMVSHHQDIFHDLFNKEIKLITYDISVDHLQGEKNIFQHDCTLSLPHRGFDVTYGHVLLKFIETGKQYDVLINSFAALKKGGLAIHIFDREEIEGKNKNIAKGQYPVPLQIWEDLLDRKKIKWCKILLQHGLALVLVKK